MNRINKQISGVLFGIGIAYITVCMLVSSYYQYMHPETGFAFFILFPTEALFTSEVFKPENLFISMDFLSDLVNQVMSVLKKEVELEPSIWAIVAISFTALGWILTVAGCFTNESKNVTSNNDEPKEKLFTHRSNAIVRTLATPVNILVSAWNSNKLLLILFIPFIPAMIPFIVLFDLAIIVPFILLRLIFALKIKSAASKEKKYYEKEVEYAICHKCKRNLTYPDMVCKCGQVMRYPVPNEYGTKYHTCNKGHDFPCVYNKGERGKLNMVCRFCNEPLNTHEARPLVVSSVGAVDSGKTTLMLGSIRNLIELGSSKNFVIESGSKGVSEEVLKSKTSVRTPIGERDSDCVFIQSPDFHEKQIVFNDISGKEYEAYENKNLFEEYFSYTDGFIFSIDGSILKSDVKKSLNAFSTFLGMLHNITGSSPASISKTPLAIVVTKADSNPIKGEIQLSETVLGDSEIRAYLLKNGHDEFIKLAESQFMEIRYFATSIVGGTNKGSDMPIRWILSAADKDLIRLN